MTSPGDDSYKIAERIAEGDLKGDMERTYGVITNVADSWQKEPKSIAKLVTQDLWKNHRDTPTVKEAALAIEKRFGLETVLWKQPDAPRDDSEDSKTVRGR